ncbi:glycosyltransferase family 2 protein [Homoserinibacter sp. YIM 151385]|uniref:glycosyltransferase family 2 protein n=1 Tax=Homoserinibacter sp. YIM 151385 TaxID=2985506 RepID=UPI0022EFED0B|nr:glycosyltransferase family 2 protein [Homoserinibacter sp. YIM 151385]WBU38835.1 glycosyltransferase family 2 protein [Homoserinibacter sp. YIM 151385]
MSESAPQPAARPAEHPGVTVVVPTHDRPELMALAVRSVLEQDHEGPIEVVIVFDAAEVCIPELVVPAGRSIRGVPNSRTRGLAGARNTGILEATTELVAFLDDDDVWLPAKLRRQLERLRDDPAALLVGTAMLVDDGERIHERLVGAELVERPQLIANRLPGLHSSSLLFRREALLGELGLIDEELPISYGEDYDILLRTAAIAPVRVVDEPLVKVRWTGESHFMGKWAKYAEALRYLLRKHPDFLDAPRPLGRIQAQVAFALAASGQPAVARRWARRALRNDPRQLKAAIAIAISLRLVTPDRVARVARRFGKGI